MSTHDTAPSPERLGEPLTAEEEAALRDPVYLDKVIGENEVIRRLLATLDAERASRPSEGEAALRGAAQAVIDAWNNRPHPVTAAMTRLRVALATPVPADDRP